MRITRFASCWSVAALLCLAAAPAAAQGVTPDTTPLSPRELANAEAVARLLGVVRYFHPSDEAAMVDWDSAVVATMRAALPARDAADLARRLTSAVAPVTQSVVVRAAARGASSASPATRPVPEGATGFTFWVHDGVRLSDRPNAYGSRRERRLWTGATLPDSMPDPRRPQRVTLGADLEAWVPIALWTDGAGTLLRSGVAGFLATLPQMTDSTRVARLRDTTRYDMRDRAVRLADVALAWMVFEHFYPYFDVVPVDWDAQLARALRDAARAGDACALRGVLARLVASLQDGHGGVYHPCDVRRLPGLRVASIEGRLVVVAVDTSVAGVRRGDVLLAVDGEPVAARLARLRPGVSASTSQYMDYRLSMEVFFGGPEGSDVRLDLERADGTRATAVAKRLPPSVVVAEPKPPVIHELRPGLWYVDLDRVTTAQFTEALPKLAAAKGLVFDLRGYPRQLMPEPLFSHLSRDTTRSAQWWVPRQVRPRAGARREPLPFVRRESWRIPPREPYLAAPRAFIIDGRAISYAESVMGIVEHYRFGEIVGEATAGTNGNVNPFVLPGGYNVAWTGMRVLKHDGTTHHGVGIRPTVPLARTRAAVVAGRDEYLERAVEIVQRAAPTAAATP